MNALRITWISALLSAAAAFAAEPFAIQAYGNFRQMAHTGKTHGVVKLAELGNAKGSYGVGDAAKALMVIRLDLPMGEACTWSDAGVSAPNRTDAGDCGIAEI